MDTERDSCGPEFNRTLTPGATLSALERRRVCCHQESVKYIPLLALILLASCETPQRKGKVAYTKLTVTDTSGDLIAEWVAEGRVKKSGAARGALVKSEEGYTIMAVERLSGAPYPQHLRYPNRRVATVVGPNIVLEKIGKPDWLKELDDETR